MSLWLRRPKTLSQTSSLSSSTAAFGMLSISSLLHRSNLFWGAVLRRPPSLTIKSLLKVLVAQPALGPLKIGECTTHDSSSRPASSSGNETVHTVAWQTTRVLLQRKAHMTNKIVLLGCSNPLSGYTTSKYCAVVLLSLWECNQYNVRNHKSTSDRHTCRRIVWFTARYCVQRAEYGLASWYTYVSTYRTAVWAPVEAVEDAATDQHLHSDVLFD